MTDTSSVPDTGSVTDTGSVADTGSVTDTGIPIADAPAPKLSDKPNVGGEFQRCSKDSECSSGFCVEGVCCDARCGDRCHSCALLSNPGKCTLEPIGVDLKNECGPALSCLGTCGPSGECVGSGQGTMCARNRCVSPSKGVGPAYCSGPGAACPTSDVVAFDCSPYICEAAFGACRTTCASSEDCANGFVCDVAAKACVPAPTPASPEVGDDGGGCAYHGDRRTTSAAVLGVLGLALALRRARRSAS
jgi:hypothetical protein